MYLFPRIGDVLPPRSPSGIKNKIIRVLCKNGEMYIGQIAKKAKLARATVSRYIQILEAEGVVERREQKPYIYFKIKEGDVCEKK